jgi:UDP-N-acetylmuramate dehydrogenase
MIEIQENVCLAPYTTLQVGGNASYFIEPRNEGEVIEALRWAQTRALPVFVLGGGSNLLVSDAGFHGLVLHIAIVGIDTHAEGDKRIYSAGAGVEWDTLVEHAVEDNCAGVECLSGIPGSVGGTPKQLRAFVPLRWQHLSGSSSTALLAASATARADSMDQTWAATS